ncbi:MAG: DUF2274 domain-containing protein [Hyphomicrobiales bacterium]|nr:DUF2274 domain-containing protein [Hyphomicrobiales bacterium]
MASLKLGKLPDRETTKITFTASAELNALLADYASAYEAEYGLRESIADIIPHMLDAFIKTDRGFQKTNRTSAFGEISDAKTNHSNDRN